MFEASKLYPLLVMIGFGLMGLGAIAKPLLVTRQFGIDSLTASGRNEVRAVYGGFGLAMSGVIAFALTNPVYQPGILLATGVALLGMAVGRLVSALMDRGMDSWPLFYLAIEVVCGLALILSI